MTLEEAHDLIDLLLDKADQPYFITDEKNRFLDLAISDFISYHYQKMDIDEDSRRALAGCKDYNKFEITWDEMLAGTYLDTSINQPTLSEKYDESTGTEAKGYFINGFDYVLPPQHLYLLQVTIGKYSTSTLSSSTGQVNSWYENYATYPGIDWKNVKIVSLQKYYEASNSDDPFGIIKDGAIVATYIENTLVFSPEQLSGRKDLTVRYPRIPIRNIEIKSLTLPTIKTAFIHTGQDGYITPGVFSSHYLKQIIQIAVEKMTKVDVGLMTPPA